MYKIYSFLHIVLPAPCSMLLGEINILDEAWNLCCCSMWNNTLNIKSCKIWTKSYAFYRLSCLLMDMDDLENIKSKTKHKKATQYIFLNLGQGWESMNWLLYCSICIKIQSFSDSPSINALPISTFECLMILLSRPELYSVVQHIKFNAAD